jgi:hypothetical protein
LQGPTPEPKRFVHADLIGEAPRLTTEVAHGHTQVYAVISALAPVVAFACWTKLLIGHKSASRVQAITWILHGINLRERQLVSSQSSNYLKWLAAAACSALGVNAAHADLVTNIGPGGTLTAASTWSDTAAGQTPNAVLGNPGTTSAPVVVNNLLGNPSSTYTFTNTISAPNGSFAGFQVSDAAQGQTSESVGFLDSYVFTVPAAMANASVFSLNLSSTLGLSDLTMRLYDYSSTNGYQVNSTGPVSSSMIVDNWSLSNNANQNNPVANSTLSIGSLQQGTYVLEVVGLETGSASGTYSGQLNLAPVPLPAAAWLLVSGMGALGAFRRRRAS